MPSLSKRIKRRYHLFLKTLYQSLIASRHQDKNVLFIVGCQRSGTTMLMNIFERDNKIKLYRELSKLSTYDELSPREFKPLDEVDRIIRTQKMRDVVGKPIVESQNTDRLLDEIGNSNALWVNRHYRDVVASNLKSFGINNGLRNLSYIFDEVPNNWRSDRVSEKTKEIVRKYYSESLSEYDAAALFWYARNVLFFERELQNDPRVLICKYEDFVSSAGNIMRRIYQFMGSEYPAKDITYDVHPRSVGKGKKVEISPEIESMCENLYSQLEEAYQNQNDLYRIINA